MTTRRCVFPVSILLLLFGVAPGAAVPRVRVDAWSEHLRPAVFDADTTQISWKSHALSRVEGSLLPELEARWQPHLPQVDGDLSDWPLVRWHAVRDHNAVVRGTWRGATDASMRFAILWNQEGVFLGAEAIDDSLVLEAPRGHEADSFFFSFGTQSASAQRWWRGSDRTFQVWPDGHILSTTLMRNRRRIPFDAEVLGARGAVRLGRNHQGRSGDIVVHGTLQAELFVPWSVLFPLLPDEALQAFANVLYEDVDPSDTTLLGAATRIEAGQRQPSWSRLLYAGTPPPGTLLLSLSSTHLETSVPLEWAALRLGGSAKPWDLQWQCDDAVVRATCPPGVSIGRLDTDGPSGHLWQSQRRVQLRARVDHEERDFDVFVAPDAATLSGDLDELLDLETTQEASVVFPRVPDVIVRLHEVAEVVRTGLGAWPERRFHESGIAVWRASLWMLLEKRIARAELLRDQIVDPQANAAPWQEVFPDRTPRGVPTGQVLTRGYRSVIDGSVQPYAMMVSKRVAETPVPLVVALHSIDKNEMDLFENTSLARRTEEHGWITVCPYGRGDTGFLHAGETDVLDVIDAVAAALPVDRSRLFALGAGMGGTAAWLLSLRHPDLFDAACVVSAFGDMDQQDFFQLLGYHPRELFHFETMNPIRLIRPGIRTHYLIHHASADPVVPVSHAQAMHDKLQEYGASSKLVIDVDARHGEPLLEGHLESILDFFAEQPAGSTGQPRREWFGGSGGPLATVYGRGAFSVVYGTHALPPGSPPVGETRRAGRSVTGPQADARTAQQFAMEWQSIYKGSVRLVPDTLVTTALQEEQNLVLVGDPRTNGVLAQIAKGLPVQWDGDDFTIAGRSYDFAQNGVVFAAPHPDFPDRTVVVISGMAERLGNFEKSLLKLGTDYIVTDDDHRFVDLGQFDRFVLPRTPGGSQE